MATTRPWLSFAAALALGGCAAQQTPPSPQAAAMPDGGNVLNVADAAIAGGDPQMALKVSQSVLATDPHNLPALYHEAASYYAVDRCEDAIAAYKVALGLDPHSSDAQTGIGRCLLKRNALEAEQAFAAAVADNPQNAAALNDLGIARDLHGDFAGATQPYQQALLIDPGNLSTEVNLGLSLALSGDPDDGLQYLGPLAAGTDATPKIREDYATALIAAGRADEARQTLAIDVPPQQLDQAMATLAALIAPPVQAAPPPVAQAQTPPAVLPAVSAAVSPAVSPAVSQTPPPAAIASAPLAAFVPAAAAPAPSAAPIILASAQPQPLAPALIAAPSPAAPSPAVPLPVAAPSNASLPLADAPPAAITQPQAPSATIALAPAISGPLVSAPAILPPASPRHHRRRNPAGVETASQLPPPPG